MTNAGVCVNRLLRRRLRILKAVEKERDELMLRFERESDKHHRASLRKEYAWWNAVYILVQIGARREP